MVEPAIPGSPANSVPAGIVLYEVRELGEQASFEPLRDSVLGTLAHSAVRPTAAQTAFLFL